MVREEGDEDGDVRGKLGLRLASLDRPLSQSGHGLGPLSLYAGAVKRSSGSSSRLETRTDGTPPRLVTGSCLKVDYLGSALFA